jgi:hypothetical protein
MPDAEYIDPKEQGPKPPFPPLETVPPDHERELQPRADHGEQTYKGSDRLMGKTAVITGGDSGIAEPWPSRSRGKSPTS